MSALTSDRISICRRRNCPNCVNQKLLTIVENKVNDVHKLATETYEENEIVTLNNHIRKEALARMVRLYNNIALDSGDFYIKFVLCI